MPIDVSKKVRRHTNTKGYRQIKRGKTAKQVKNMCKRLGLPYRVKNKAPHCE